VSEHPDHEWQEFQRWKASRDASPRPSPVTAPPHVLHGPDLPPPVRKRRRPWLVVGITAAATVALGVGSVLGIDAISSAQEDRAVAEVETLISHVGHPVSLDDSDAVNAASVAYFELSEDLRSRVSNAQALLDASDVLTRQIAKVAKVQTAIDAVSGPDDCNAIITAADEHSSLTIRESQEIEDPYDALGNATRCRAQRYADDEARKTRLSNLIRLNGDWYRDSRETAERGCNYFVTPNFTNLSDKRLDYVWFTIHFVNRLGDTEAAVDGRANADLRVIGPIEPGATYRNQDVGFMLNYGCGAVDGLSVDRVIVQYANGARETVEANQLRCAKSWSKECEG